MIKTVIVTENKITEYEAIIIEHQAPAFEILDILQQVVKEDKKITMSDILFILLVKHQEYELESIKVLEKRYFRSEESLYKTSTMKNSKSYIIIKKDNEFLFELEGIQSKTKPMLHQLDHTTMTKEEIFEVIISNPNRAHFLLIRTEEMSRKYDEAAKEYELPNCPLGKDFLKQTQYGLLKTFIY